jgi:hypothetical protein
MNVKALFWAVLSAFMAVVYFEYSRQKLREWKWSL